MLCAGDGGQGESLPLGRRRGGAGPGGWALASLGVPRPLLTLPYLLARPRVHSQMKCTVKEVTAF